MIRLLLKESQVKYTNPSPENHIQEALEELKKQGIREDSIQAVEHIPAREGRYLDYPQDVHPSLVSALQDKGFSRLYTHQHKTWELLQQNKNVVVVTPTASGKTLCYNLPVLDSILNNPSARSIYLFPTKALSQDQRAELDDTIKKLPSEKWRNYIYFNIPLDD